MDSYPYLDRCRELEALLDPLASKVRDEEAWWIEGPNGTHCTDNGFLWCADCSYFMWRHLRRKDPKNAEDYFRCRAFGSEEAEGHEFCCGCHVHLNVSLLHYGVLEELAHYEENGFCSDRAEDAYCLTALIRAVECDDGEMAPKVISLAEKFVSMENA